MNSNIFLLALFLFTHISTSNVESFDLKNYRLPTWAFPNHYYVNIDLRHPEADTFRAYTWIDVNVTEEDHYELVFNVDPLYIDINTSTITVDTVEYICDTVNYSNDTQIMVLTCVYDMYGNLTRFAQFEMHYTAKFSETPAGLCKHKYKVNGTEKFVIFSQFEPTKFRRVFPSFDEPSFKAPIRLSVDHDHNLTVESNMPEADDADNSATSTNFQDTPSMSSYLFAVVAGISDDWDHTWLSYTGHFSILRQEIFSDYVSVASVNAPTLLEKMESWTGIEYEVLGNRKLTLAAVPGMDGAMENWGLIIFAEKYLIDEGDRTTSKSVRNILTTMAREMSHQWFGSYLTINWWTEIWLNEGFARYFKWHLANMLSTDDNDYRFDDLFVIEELQVALLGDGPTANPLSTNDSSVNTPDEISKTLDADVSFSKGGSILRMLSHALGEEVFQKGVQEYLKAKALGNVNADDLIQHLQAALPNDTDIDLPTYVDPWIYQPGYPVVRTSFGDTGQGYYLMSLDIYKFSPSLNNTRNFEESIWWVPISYITSDNPDPATADYFWINPGRTFGLYVPKENDSWGIVNADATGFYRVDYDTESMARIINILNNSDTYTDVAAVNRAQVLDDVFNIAKYYTEDNEIYDHRPYVNAFQVAEYLKYETDYLPWYTFLKEVQYLLDEIRDELTEDTLKKDVLALIQPQLILPDPNDQTQLTHTDVLKRNLILEWACKLNHDDAVGYAKYYFNLFMQDPKSILSDYRDVVICHGFKNSNDLSSDYSTLLTIYSKSILPQEKSDIAIGMACTVDSDLLTSYLESTLTADPPIDREFWAPAFKVIYSQSPEGLDVALHFMVNHIDEITQKWKGSAGIESMFAAIAKKVIKPEHIKLLQSLLLENSLDPALAKAVQGAIDRAEHNVEWIDKFGTEITSVLVYGGGDVPTTTTITTTPNELPTTTHSKGVNIVYNMFSLFVMIAVSFLYKYFF